MREQPAAAAAPAESSARGAKRIGETGDGERERRCGSATGGAASRSTLSRRLLMMWFTRKDDFGAVLVALVGVVTLIFVFAFVLFVFGPEVVLIGARGSGGNPFGHPIGETGVDAAAVAGGTSTLPLPRRLTDCDVR